MTQITATLTIPAEQESLMADLLAEVRQLRATMRQEDILTEAEAAEALKVGLTTLRKWRSEGWVPFFCEGKLIKYERRALVEAYKAHFGRVTHFEVIKTTTTTTTNHSFSKRKVS